MDFVHTIHIGLHRSGDNVRVGPEAVINPPFVLHLHMHLAGVVGTLGDTLDCEFVDVDLAFDDLPEGID